MPDTIRVYCHLQGGIFHPADDRPTPIDYRCGEIVQSSELPAKRLKLIDRPAMLERPFPNPRLVIVRNRAGADLERYPDGEAAARLERSVLRLSVFGAGVLDVGRTSVRPAVISQEMTAALLPLRLLPCRPGVAQGGAQAFWLAPGAELWLAPEDPNCPVPVHVLWCPGSDAAAEAVPASNEKVGRTSVRPTPAD